MNPSPQTKLRGDPLDGERVDFREGAKRYVGPGDLPVGGMARMSLSV